MSDLGPFAIRRIESRAASGAPIVMPEHAPAPVAAELKRAAEVFTDRVTGEVERNSPADAEATVALRTQASAIDADALSPLLDALSRPPALLAPPPSQDALAPATSAPRDSSGPSVDPSADAIDAMRASVFHPLTDLAAVKVPGAGVDAGTRASGHATDHTADRLGPLLDEFLPNR